MCVHIYAMCIWWWCLRSEHVPEHSLQWLPESVWCPIVPPGHMLTTAHTRVHKNRTSRPMHLATCHCINSSYKIAVPLSLCFAVC